MTNNQDTEDWDAYAEYNKILRGWFVAFGIGVPATFLINKDLLSYIFGPRGDHSIFVVFLCGAATQVAIAFINKIINWCKYYQGKKPPERPAYGFWVNFSAKIAKASNWFLIDFMCDTATIICYFYAIVRLFILMLATHSSLDINW